MLDKTSRTGEVFIDDTKEKLTTELGRGEVEWLMAEWDKVTFVSSEPLPSSFPLPLVPSLSYGVSSPVEATQTEDEKLLL